MFRMNRNIHLRRSRDSDLRFHGLLDIYYSLFDTDCRVVLRKFWAIFAAKTKNFGVVGAKLI